MTLRAYAERIGENEQTVTNWKLAAEVAVFAGKDFQNLTGYGKHLVAIHAAPEATWKAGRRKRSRKNSALTRHQ